MITEHRYTLAMKNSSVYLTALLILSATGTVSGKEVKIVKLEIESLTTILGRD